MRTMQGKFTDNLGKVYGMYTLGFLGFFILMAILEQLGAGARTIGVLFLLFTIAIYALIGWLSRTTQVDEYYVAGREVPALYNGMATAADWMSGASFVALAGGIYFGGYPYLGFVVGWTGGYVLVNSLMAPYLRKFGCYTVPDFIGTRYGGNTARLFAVIILVVASFTYVTAQINASGTIAARALGIPFEIGVWLGIAGILVCSMLGGMRGVTWTQVAQYIVLIIAYLVPVIWMSNKQGFGIIPHFSYGDAVNKIAGFEAQYGLEAAKEGVAGLRVLTTPHNAPAGGFDSWKFVTLAFCMMTGTASLPHILMRYFTTPSVRAARKSVGWSLLFIFLLYFTAPALATLTKLQLLDPSLPTAVIGKSLADVQALEWVKNWSAVGMLSVVDQSGDGIVQLNEFFMRPDIVVLATPEIAGLPYVISGLVAAGGMAAAMSTADGLLLAIANALSHDLYYSIIDPKADTKKRLVVARILLVGIGVLGALVASLKLTGILGAVAWAFCFAASGLFIPLVLGIWWKRANTQGAIAGMGLGFLSGTLYLYLIYTGTMDTWWGIDGLRFAVIGMPIS
ncbi:MAG: cation acetate symporter, partial [Rhizobiales bacterium]|nr:cation acetate symporter [Hyphomicrobiales bacterium]